MYTWSGSESYILKKTIVRLHMSATNTFHWLSRYQVVLNKRLLSEIILLIRMWVFEFCHNISCWVLSQFELLNFVTLWVFEIDQTLRWNSSQFKFLSFLPLVFFLVLLQLYFLSFVTIWVFEFFNNLSFWVVSTF